MILGSLVPQGTESGIESLSWNECQAVQKALALLAGVQQFGIRSETSCAALSSGLMATSRAWKIKKATKWNVKWKLPFTA